MISACRTVPMNQLHRSLFLLGAVLYAPLVFLVILHMVGNDGVVWKIHLKLKTSAEIKGARITRPINQLSEEKWSATDLGLDNELNRSSESLPHPLRSHPQLAFPLTAQAVLAALSCRQVPMPQVTVSIAQLLHIRWTSELFSFLKSLTYPGPVTLVASNTQYRALLLNWLVSALIKADEPLHNLLVIAFDSKLGDLLKNRSIPAILVAPETVMSQDSVTRVGPLFATRITVMRLINCWGYDVAFYDIDAIILRNPEELYRTHNDSDIISSSGKHPAPVATRWGFTLCMGTILIRSTIRTELLWTNVSQVKLGGKFVTDDQVCFNHGLMRAGIHWDQRDAEHEEVHGVSDSTGLKVIVLPSTAVCRLCHPDHQSTYYVWHHLGGKRLGSKLNHAKDNDMWFLKKNWLEIVVNSTANGTAWLREMSVFAGTS